MRLSSLGRPLKAGHEPRAGSRVVRRSANTGPGGKR